VVAWLNRSLWSDKGEDDGIVWKSDPKLIRVQVTEKIKRQSLPEYPLQIPLLSGHAHEQTKVVDPGDKGKLALGSTSDVLNSAQSVPVLTLEEYIDWDLVGDIRSRYMGMIDQ